MGDSKFDRNQFHPLSLFLLLVTTSDSPQYTVLDRIGFQPMRNTIACLQFDHIQRFESTTDRFALQIVR